MGQKKVGIGIIGAGFIGQAHARVLSEYEKASLVAIADLDESRGKALAAAYNVDYYEDYKKMLQREDVTAVVICTPDHLHLAPVQDTAEAKKHMLLEKPIASTIEDGEKIISCASDNSVRLMVGHSLRFHYPYSHLNDCVKRGDVGELVHGYARRNARIIDGRRFHGNTSVLLFLAVHDIDFLRWCTGSEVVRVYAESHRKALRDVGVDDSVLSILKFSSGFVASLENSWILPENFGAVVDAKMQIVGTKGNITFDAYDQGIMCWTESGGRLGPPSSFFGQMLSSVREQDRHFVDRLLDGKEFEITGETALGNLKVALAIQQSLDTGQPVDLT